jgi:hypothetical protein
MCVCVIRVKSYCIQYFVILVEVISHSQLYVNHAGGDRFGCVQHVHNYLSFNAFHYKKMWH